MPKMDEKKSVTLPTEDHRDPVIEFRGLSFGYPDHPLLLHDIDLKLFRGERTVLLGANGAGKSTLFKLLTGLVEPKDGQIIFHGKAFKPKGKALHELRSSVGMVFQDPDHQLFASTVRQEVSFGAMNLELPEQEVRRRTEAALQLTGLEALSAQAVQYLSFGQKKRVSIADLLVMDSEVLLLDEPTAWLDPGNTRLITSLLASLAESGIGLFTATHDVDWAYAFSERMVLLHEGRILYDGPTATGFADRELMEKAGLPVPVMLGVSRLLGGLGLELGETEARTMSDLSSWCETHRERPAGDGCGSPSTVEAGQQRPSVFPMETDKLSNDGKRKLRCGYTTGSCATAGALASVLLRKGLIEPDCLHVDILTPEDKTLRIPLASAERLSDGSWRCGIIKDGGDDPDATHGLLIRTTVRENDQPGQFRFVGGQGVGTVTLPGLKVEPGEPAINPAPRQMIERALSPYLPENGGFTVEIDVPDGERVAAKTFNPRLGIEGGISIIGTTGLVVPMSEEAFKDSLKVELTMARATEHPDDVVLSFGNTSDKLAAACLPPEAGRVVACSNFVGYMLRESARLGFRRVTLSGPLGKIIKVSAGIFNTHSHVADARVEITVATAALLGASSALLEELSQCKATDAALVLLEKEGLRESFIAEVARKAVRAMEVFEHLGLDARVLMSDGKGQFLIYHDGDLAQTDAEVVPSVVADASAHRMEAEGGSAAETQAEGREG